MGRARAAATASERRKRRSAGSATLRHHQIFHSPGAMSARPMAGRAAPLSSARARRRFRNPDRRAPHIPSVGVCRGARFQRRQEQPRQAAAQDRDEPPPVRKFSAHTSRNPHAQPHRNSTRRITDLPTSNQPSARMTHIPANGRSMSTGDQRPMQCLPLYKRSLTQPTPHDTS